MPKDKFPLPTKAIVAAAGFGTRFLPQTKSIPKEMMPIIDKPIIQHVVEQLVEAGIKDIIIVGNSNKRTIEDHFDAPKPDLLYNLRQGGESKIPLINQIEDIAAMANFAYVRQKGPYGNATPLICAAHLIGDEPFIYTFADDFFDASPGSAAQLVDNFRQHGTSVVACKRVVRDEEYDKYGIVNGEVISKGLMKIANLDEKPGKKNAKSNLASVSEYLFTPDILPHLMNSFRNYDERDGELAIQPAIQQMINDGKTVQALEIQNGKFCDTGDKLEYLKTVVNFGLKHETMGGPLRQYIEEKLAQSKE